MSDVPVPMNGEQDDRGFYVVGYMCLVDFECEIGAASGGNTIYPSIEDCRKHRTCIRNCGIVEVEVRLRKVVQPEKEYWNEQ